MTINWHIIIIPLLNWYDRKMGYTLDIPITTKAENQLMATKFFTSKRWQKRMEERYARLEREGEKK